MGFKKSQHSEMEIEKTEKAEIDTAIDGRSTQDSLETATESLNASSSTSLDVLLEDITSSKEEWPKEALRRVLGRFGRMPRSGWSRAHDVYCGKFSIRTSLVEFKENASKALINMAGRKCTIREFNKESVKRVKTDGIILEENSLLETKIYTDVKAAFLGCIREASNKEIEEVDRTRKISSEKINHLVLEAVAKAVGDYVYTKPPIKYD